MRARQQVLLLSARILTAAWVLIVAASPAARGQTGAESSVGYLDNAIPMTMFRLRYDDSLNVNRFDRAEYFYADWKELSFHPHGILKNGIFQGTFFDPHALGPQQSPGQLNSQEISAYLEYAVHSRLSGFVDLPVRFVHFGLVEEDLDRDNRPPLVKEFPEQEEKRNPSNSPNGLSDIQFGFKAALVAEPDQYLTFQFCTYSPTGDPRTGLGTGHWSVEPSLLYHKRLDRWSLQGQFSDWIPLHGGPAAGNVLKYGAGVGYDVFRRGTFHVTPITELVGWTVLDGFESFFSPGAVIPQLPGLGLEPEDHGVASAAGDTIINAKVGVRTYFGHGSDVYLGWGHSLTGDRWYKDIFRVEYRFVF